LFPFPCFFSNFILVFRVSFQRNENGEILKIPVNELDSLMANFITAAKKKDGFDYEPTSIRGIISSIDRKPRRHRYGNYIGGDEKHTKIPLTKETLKTKMKLLKKQGKGNKPNRPIPDSEMDILIPRIEVGS
jgi:hypothetical protein